MSSNSLRADAGWRPALISFAFLYAGFVGVEIWATYKLRVDRKKAVKDQKIAWDVIMHRTDVGQAVRDALHPELAGTTFSFPQEERAALYRPYEEACDRERDTYSYY
jgi:hypothetical protein